MSDPVPTGSVQGVSPAVVYIAKCPEHGLHGERDECFVCAGPVESVTYVRGDLFTALRAGVDAARGHLTRLESDLSSLYWNAEGEGPQEPPEHLTDAIANAVEALAGSPLVSGEPVKLVPVDVAAVERAAVRLADYERTGTDLTPEARVACVIRALADVPGPDSKEARDGE